MTSEPSTPRVDVGVPWFVKAGCEHRLEHICDHPHDAWHTAHEFQGLQWWLHPDVLKWARSVCDPSDGLDEMWGQPLPKLPELNGCCWIVLAHNMSGFPLLRDAFLFPLRWIPCKDPSPHGFWLPEKLKTEADHVLRALEKSDPIPGRYWRLHPCQGCENDPRGSLDLRFSLLAQRFDFRNLQFQTWESCWASLAAGLLVAMRGGKVKPGVWASARWASNKWAGVEPKTLEKKLGLAEEWGAERFYLHYENRADAEAIKESRRWKLKIEPLGLAKPQASDPDEPPAQTVLKPLLEALEAPPTKYDGLERCTAHFLSLTDDEQANDFYHQEIIGTVAETCRTKLIRKVGERALTRPRLISILSKSPVALLGAMTVQPREWLILYTEKDPDVQKNLESIVTGFRHALRELNPHPDALDPRSFSRRDHDFRARFTELIRDFIDREPDEPLIFDATSGTQLMNINLMLCARPVDWLLVIDSEISRFRRRRVLPDTADPYLLPKA